MDAAIAAIVVGRGFAIGLTVSVGTADAVAKGTLTVLDVAGVSAGNVTTGVGSGDGAGCVATLVTAGVVVRVIRQIAKPPIPTTTNAPTAAIGHKGVFFTPICV